MWKTRFIGAALVSLLVPLLAPAQTPADSAAPANSAAPADSSSLRAQNAKDTSTSKNEFDALLDKIIRISSMNNCEQMRKAFESIPESAFASAHTALSQSPRSLEASRARLDRIIELSQRCPNIQDAFAARMAKLMAASSLRDTVRDTSDSAKASESLADSVATIRDFVDRVHSGIQHTTDCAASPDVIAALPNGLCARAIRAFQTTPPSRLSDADYHHISDKIAAISDYMESCAPFKTAYQTCLGSPDTIARSRLQPFLDWLSALQHAVSSTPCDQLPTAIDALNPRPASDAIRGISPSQLAPDDRDRIQAQMRTIYTSAPACSDARKLIDGAIERVFAHPVAPKN